MDNIENEETHESLTTKATRKQNQAARKRTIAADQGFYGYIDCREAELLEREASELLTVDRPPKISSGEVVTRKHSGETFKPGIIRDTLKDGGRVAIDASIDRTDLMLKSNFNIVALAVDAADSIKAENSLEKMLAHQMALCHKAAFELMDKSLSQRDTVEQVRLSNAAARLMATFQQGLLTIQRLRNNGNQTVTVQHVHVEPGGQAVIGNVQAGGCGAGEATKNER